MSSDFITAFYTTTVRPQAGDPGGQRVGGARVAQVRTNRATPEHNPTMQATGMCRPINYTAIFEAMPKLPAWIADAPCSQADPELFFPEAHESRANVALAKRVCAACPVRQECLEWALARGEKFGIYGGLTTTQRRKVSRQRAKDSAA